MNFSWEIGAPAPEKVDKMKRTAGILLKVVLSLLLLTPLAPAGLGQTKALSSEPQENQTAAREYFIREYIIGPRDLLEIKVFELPEFDHTVRVSEDGSITLPLLGNVQVGGLTKEKVEQKIADLLDKYVKKAQVSVFIKEYQSSRVAIIGAVEKPGMYELVGRQTLLQMVSQAGGFKENAANEIYILREGQDGNTASISIDLEDLLLNGNQRLNIPLQPNDVINVPVDKLITIYVFGQAAALEKLVLSLKIIVPEGFYLEDVFEAQDVGLFFDHDRAPGFVDRPGDKRNDQGKSHGYQGQGNDRPSPPIEDINVFSQVNFGRLQTLGINIIFAHLRPHHLCSSEYAFFNNDHISLPEWDVLALSLNDIVQVHPEVGFLAGFIFSLDDNSPLGSILA